MDAKIRDNLFWLICLSFPFTVIPVNIRFAGMLSNQLVALPLIIALLFSVYYQIKGCDVLYCPKKYLCIFLIYGIVSLISAIHASQVFPYWEDIIGQEPYAKWERLFFFLIQHGVALSENTYFKIVFIFKELNTGFLMNFLYFSGAYMIFSWYRNNLERCLNIVYKACCIIIIIAIPFVILEFMGNSGNLWAKKVLMDIAPYLRDVPPVDHFYHWRSLWWQGRFRGPFQEPNTFAFFLTATIPFLLFRIKQSCQKYNVVIFILSVILLALAQSRAMIVIAFCEVIIYIFVMVKWKEYKKIGIVSLCVIFSFIAGIFIVHSSQGLLLAKKQVVKQVENVDSFVKKYYVSNVKSLGKINAKSNAIRFGMAYAAVDIWKEYPLFGIGKTFQSSYIARCMPEWGKNGEWHQKYKRWQKNKEPVFMGLSFGYAQSLVAYGLIGLVCEIGPFLFILFHMGKYLWNYSDVAALIIFMQMIAFFLFMIAGPYYVTFSFAISIGVGGIIYYQYKKKLNEDSVGY